MGLFEYYLKNYYLKYVNFKFTLIYLLTIIYE